MLVEQACHVDDYHAPIQAADLKVYRPRPIKVVHQAQGWLKVYKFLNAQYYGNL